MGFVIAVEYIIAGIVHRKQGMYSKKKKKKKET